MKWQLAAPGFLRLSVIVCVETPTNSSRVNFSKKNMKVKNYSKKSKEHKYE